MVVACGRENAGRRGVLQDFIEVNPPMCVYIYLPAVIIHHLFHIDLILSITIYLFLLVIASYIFCLYLINKIFAKTAKLILYSLSFALAFSYFLLPAFNFGEREYLLVVLTMPYLLITVLTLAKQPVNRVIRLIAGVIAAIGFAQKPYFMPIWFGIELYVLITSKNIKAVCRPEALACISIYALYALSLLLFTPQYITKIIPMASATYYMLYRVPLHTLLLHPAVYFLVILILLTVLLRKHSRYTSLIDLLSISLLGCLLLYLAQQTLWSYHLLPIFMVGSLLLAVLIAEFLPQYNPLQIQALNSYFYKILGLTSSFAVLITLPVMVACKSIDGSFFYANLIFKQPAFKLLKSLRGNTIYIFTNDQIHNYLLLDYSQTVTPAHSPSLWLITAADELAAATHNPAQKLLAIKIANVIRQTEISAIILTKPAYIFVQNDEYQVSNGAADFWSNHFIIKRLPIDNHLNYFLQDKRFAEFWQNYRNTGQIGNFSVYQLIK